MTRARGTVLAGALVLAGVVILDALASGRHIYVSAFLLGPVIAALSGGARAVAAVAGAAVLAALASFVWNDNWGEFEYFFRVAVMLAGSTAAVLAASERNRAEVAAAASRDAGAQLEAVLSNLAEAVTVQDTDGKLVFANQAAADLLDAGTPEALLQTPPQELMARFATVNEDGSPLRPEQLPGRQVLAGREATPLLVRATNRRTGEERWRLTKASAVRGDDGAVRYAVNVIEDITEAKRAELHQRLLAEASSVLASSLNYTETLQQVAEMAVPDFADWCSVTMPGRPPYLDQVAIAHVDPERLEFAQSLRERYPPRLDTPGGVGEVLRTGRPQLVTGITDEMIEAGAVDAEHARLLRGLGLRSGIIAPMRAGPRTTGAITFVSAESGREFTEAELTIAVELGRRAGVAVENSRLFTERSEVADSLQQGLLPPELPEMGDWSAAAHYQPASDASAVGGDFYDVLRVRDGWMVFVGDVAGRGPAAATLTALARYTLRTAGALSGDPLVALASLNRALRERDRLSLCSACVVMLREDGETGRAEVLLAGHPPPLVLRGSQVERVGQSGPLLGAIDDVTWPIASTALDRGEQIVLYTDGVIDAQGSEDRFGEDRLVAAVRGARRPLETIERVGRALADFSEGLQRDDVALLAVLRGAPAPTSDAPLPDGRDAARAARRIVEHDLAEVLGEAALADARLMVSEVVTNAVRHAADGPVTLTVSVEDEFVRIEVRDPGDGFEVPAGKPDPQLSGGRGLMLVDLLAARWGIASEGGTCVWFEVPRR